MAEGSILGLASRILSAIDSESVKMALKRPPGSTLKLEDFEEAVDAVKAVKPYLLDAERREESSVEIKNCIKTVREALYYADDVLEDVLANDVKARGGGGGGGHWRKVSSSSAAAFSSPEVTGLMGELVKACKKIEEFGLEKQDAEEANYQTLLPNINNNNVEPKEGNVSIREEDRNAILKFLLTPKTTVPLVIIAGPRGMGKTTIAQIVCKNEEVQKRYETVWWASMSDSFDEKEIYQRILESMIGKSSRRDLTLALLKAKVRGCMFSAKRFLLVLDDIWAQDFDRFMRIRPLVKIVPEGSTILVTSKGNLEGSPLDGIAVKTRLLDKLTEDDSKKLLAWFTQDQAVGRKTLEACEHVPLAMKSLSSVYYRNPGSLTVESLSKINGSVHRQRAPLMFSYEQLNQDLKHCFAYCSLFPDNYIIQKEELVNLWVAQGYVVVRSDDDDPEAGEGAIGDSYFMQLLDMSFFQDPKEDDLGNTYCCRIHDLVQDVSRQVAGEESITLMKKKEQFLIGRRRRQKHDQGSRRRRRHCAVGYEIDASWDFPPELFSEVDHLRSILFLGGGGTLNPDVLVKVLAKFKRLRALSLENLNLKEVPTSIGELYVLKYLNLSCNNFRHLPDSITKLLNLLILDISRCSELRVLPKGFSRLTKLRRLYNRECHSLRHMPPGMWNMKALEELGSFKVRKHGDESECSRIDALGKLKLTKTAIRFDHDWKQESAPIESLPETLRVLHIECYRGTNLPFFNSNQLVELHLYNCTSVRDLSSLARLNCLKNLVLFWMDDLEQIADHHNCPDESPSIFSVLSNLVKLVLRGLPKFLGWPTSTDDHHLQDCRRFTRLSFLKIEECPQFKYMPPSSHLKTLSLRAADEELLKEMLSSSSSSLEDVTVDDCDGLNCFSGGSLTSLRRLKLFNCNSLTEVIVPPPSRNLVIEKTFRNCPKLARVEGDAAAAAPAEII